MEYLRRVRRPFSIPGDAAARADEASGPFPSPARVHPLHPGAGPCTGVNVSGPIHFASATQLEGTGKTYEISVFLSADPIHMEFVPGISIPDLAHVNTKEKVNPAGYNSV